MAASMTPVSITLALLLLSFVIAVAYVALDERV
jgi:hypothetical protein